MDSSFDDSEALTVAHMVALFRQSTTDYINRSDNSIQQAETHQTAHSYLEGYRYLYLPKNHNRKESTGQVRKDRIC